LRARGLTGVRLCVSDCHEGLRAAIGQVLGCPWQRCTVHFLRSMLGHCAKRQQPMISAALRGIFSAGSGEEARERLAEVVERLEPIAPKVAQLVLDAEADLLGFYALPREHWSKLRSTDENVKGRAASRVRPGRARLAVGRGRPRSEAQVLGLRPAAQLAP
jgi:transposase-like protein